ncbi:MAG TPA: YciI family protein [Stellaceae bacterium]|nr:YciI family protein [Stellaceae bacterium]
MKYMLLIYSHETAFESASKAQVEELVGAYTAYTRALTQSGVLVAGERLQRSTAATTVRQADGKAKVLNGPYAETKEQLAGFYMIDVPDLDAALTWATRCPGATYGVVEVRPVWAM